MDDQRALTIRLPSGLIEALDQWRLSQPAPPSRTAAIIAAIREWLERQGVRDDT